MTHQTFDLCTLIQLQNFYITTVQPILTKIPEQTDSYWGVCRPHLYRLRVDRFRFASRDLQGPGLEFSVLTAPTQQPTTHGIIVVVGVIDHIQYLVLGILI